MAPESPLNDFLAGSGLDLSQIERHQRRINKWIKYSKTERFFPIHDTCRLDNHGIVDLDNLADPGETLRGFVAFIPAAGASSRFFKPLRDLLAKDESTRRRELRELDLPSLPLSPKLVAALSAYLEGGDEPKAAKAEIIHELDLPKALQPCTLEMATFLDLKLRENDLIEGVSGQVFIVPPKFRRRFDSLLADWPAKIPAKTLEQGLALSTIRFRADGDPLSVDGAPSVVPAGHGMLSKLFQDARFNQADHSLFIRNIDNVMGNVDNAIASTRRLLGFHASMLAKLTTLRSHLSDYQLRQAAEIADHMCETAGINPKPVECSGDPLLNRLAVPLVSLFHTPLSLIAERGTDRENLITTIASLYNRPFNTMGMVPNSGSDVGGTPCFVEAGGHDIKLCIEVPHASPEDHSQFLADPDKATHFNPVFVAAEIPVSADCYDGDTSPFWLIAEKSFRGEKVLYHESILYELLGNSIMANTIFAAIDRSCFNPHKTFTDSRNKTLHSWGF